MNERFSEFRTRIEQGINDLGLPAEPSNLYEPISYILSLGGKRLRPVLTLYGAALFDLDPSKVLKQALAIEIFHNFTLVHDDIMDRADLRRGKRTVHKKWNDSIGILSGDAMMVKAYQLLVEAPLDQIPALMEAFSTTALEVCEGQQFDMDFANLGTVDEAAYTNMIRLKTAVLLSAALRLGAIRANVGATAQQQLHEFAINIGLAFQIRDDYLDAFGNQEEVGKQAGGDIREGKRTWMTVKAFEISSESQRSALTSAYSNDDLDSRVEQVMNIYNDLNIASLTNSKVNEYSSRGLESLASADGNKLVKSDLEALVQFLMQRAN